MKKKMENLTLLITYGGGYFYIVKSEDFLINVSVIISQKNYNQLSHQVADLITKLFIGQVDFHSKISEDIFIVFESGLEVPPRVVFILNFFDRWNHETDFLTNRLSLHQDRNTIIRTCPFWVYFFIYNLVRYKRKYVVRSYVELKRHNENE